MKNLFIATLALAFLGAGCNSNTSKNEAPTEQIASSEQIDPICNMIKDDTWTDYSVYNNDTTWLCSPTCKDAFDKNPEKYLGNK